LEPSEIKILPVPVALVVVAIDPFGALVVVELAVIAPVRKYRPAVALAITASVVAVDVNVPEIVAVVRAAPEMVPPLMVAPVMVVPETSSGSEKATPTDLLLGMVVAPIS
jgi:hypothetical protein